jgi:tetratricopeptide (TPR) repeat protein
MIVWFFLNVAFGSMMLEASRGIIGRDSSHVMAAEEAYKCVRLQRWSECALLWSERAELGDSQRNDALIWSIICHMNANEYSEAYLLLGELILVVEEVGWPLLLLEGWLLQELDGHREVVSLLKDYPSNDVDYIGSQILMMRSHQFMKRRRKANKVVEKILQTGGADAWFWLEMSHFSSDEEKQIFLERSIRATNASNYQYIHLVNFYEEKQNFQMALRYGLEGMNLQKDANQLTYRMLKFASSKEGREVLLEQVEQVPQHSKAQVLLGLSLLSEEEYDQGIEHLKLGIEYGEKQLRTYETLIDACQKIGDEDQVWEILDVAVVQHPNNEKLWEYFYDASVSEEQKRGFLQSLNLAWKKGDQQSLDMIHRAFSYARAIQDNETALLWAERELSVSESSWKTLSRNALALSAVDRRAEAITLYEKALQLEPENSFVLNNLAWLLINPSDGMNAEPQRAYLLIQKAISNSPKPVAGYYDTLAAVLWSMGRKDEAIKAQKKAIEVDPTEKEYLERYRKYEKSIQ